MYKKLSVSAKKKLAHQLKLAEKPIEVPSFAGRKFDTRYLLDALEGRTDVSKTYGKSYAVLKGVTVPMRQLREWLTLFCQDDSGAKININKWTQDDWAYVRRDIERGEGEDKGKRTLVFTFGCEGLDVTTTFLDQIQAGSKRYDGTWEDAPVFHKIVLKGM